MKLPSGLGKMLDGPAGWAVVILVGGAAVYFGYKAIKSVGTQAATAAAGVVSGNNAITQNQVDLAGNTVTAYQGAGVVGTLGAAANSASGGAFASFGDWIGGKLFDLFNPTPPTGTNSASATGSNTAGGGSASTASTPSQLNFGSIDSMAAGW